MSVECWQTRKHTQGDTECCMHCLVTETHAKPKNTKHTQLKSIAETVAGEEEADYQNQKTNVRDYFLISDRRCTIPTLFPTNPEGLDLSCE